MLASFIAVALGGATGSVLRWWLGLRLNGLFPALPLGTLTVNLAGGLVVGLALAILLRLPGIDPVWRALIVTGFCGGLTTFSTFSAEVVTMLTSGRPGWALAIISTHLLGSLAMTLLGFALVDWLAPR
ncbi:fluoride efflux transporter CrcB [Halotalea alkalilenta]|uniref:fluoride efflux transporter CrcB n=1 Tax=Halotalea alkalilenta TaxID=376489 RepID=UPI0004804B20|nr:fluoride efflux transporter CrcB [Halotalea alkalilenta]